MATVRWIVLGILLALFAWAVHRTQVWEHRVTEVLAIDSADKVVIAQQSLRIAQLTRLLSHRDTVWRVRVKVLRDSLPVVLGSGDSSCAPLRDWATRCAAELDSAGTVADGWHAVADSNAVIAREETARADSLRRVLTERVPVPVPGWDAKKLLGFLPLPDACVAGVGPGLSFAGKGYVGAQFTCGWTVFGHHH
jgi:hypothetical protein